MDWSGYGAAVGAAVFFGSFNLPLKWLTQRVAVDPVLYQSSMAVGVALSVLVVLPASFSILGILSAALWLTSSLFAIFAVNRAGLAVAQGVWSGSTSTLKLTDIVN